MSSFTYILRCSDSTLYCGYTNDLKKRVIEHNLENSTTKYTRSRRPVELVYFEEFDSKSDAMRREAEIKKMKRKQKEFLISNGGKINL